MTRKISYPQFQELWFDEFMGPPGAHVTVQHCGLCGNRGIIDLRGKVTNQQGVECGALAFCICPNGRVMKKKGATLPP